MVNITSKIGLGLLLGSILMIFLGIFSISTALNNFEQNSDSIKCQDSQPGNYRFDGISCEDQGDLGFTSCCGGIILILIGIGIGIGGIVGLFGGAISGDKKVIIIQNETPKK
tara:strand:+ start:82 stop:417 length:336 start_codon:yes stop_codon:yes gene_type:complete